MNSATIGYGATYTTDKIAETLVKSALQIGYRTINTCLAYHNIRGMGNAIKNSGIPRSELTIIALDENERRSSEDAEHFDGYNAQLEQIYDSLDCLAVNHIDLYIINWPVPRYMENVWKKLNADSWRAMEDCVDKGLIKSIGVSNFLPYHIEELQKTAKLPIAANQLEIHPTFQQRDVVEYCRKQNIEILSWSPLFKGKSVKLPLIIELAAKYGKTPAQIVLRWDIQNNITPVVFSTNENRMRENIENFDFEIAEDDMALIAALDCGEHFENYSYARQQESIKGAN
jgi:diketogulonate reductase-like aldo/keto reductase